MKSARQCLSVVWFSPKELQGLVQLEGATCRVRAKARSVIERYIVSVRWEWFC